MNAKRTRGEIREDGMVFWSHQKSNGYDYWVTPKKFAELIEQKKKRLRLWRNKNRHHVRSQARGYRLLNLEKSRERNRLWSEQNRSKVSKKLKEWKIRNKARCVAVEQKRRARQISGTPSDSWEAVVNGFYEISERVSRCLGIKHSVDHIHPISKGGSHCHRNLQVLPFSWNSRKLAKLDAKLPDCYLTVGYRYTPKSDAV